MSNSLSFTSVLNELSDMIIIRLKSVLTQSHSKQWSEHKTHIDYDLWFIHQGEVRITIAGDEHIATAGDIVFFYPGISYYASSSTGCQFTYVHFDFGIGKQHHILQNFMLSGIIPGELITTEATQFIHHFQLQQQQHITSNRLYIKACLIQVVAKIIELHGNKQYSGTFVPNTVMTKKQGLDLLLPVFDYIHLYLDQPLRIAQLAQMSGISEKYFITYFKAAIGITPGQYINQIKMNRAREYLYTNQYSIQQIATMLGYPDPFTFSKAFKKYYDVPPSKFV